MTKLVWGELGLRVYENGLDQGVLYPDSGPGVAWNGLTAVRENPNVEEPVSYYIDGDKYLSVAKRGEFSGTIEAVTYPDEFAVYDGWTPSINGLMLGGQLQRSFGFAYRTIVGNATEGANYGYKIHLVYQAMVKPAANDYSSLNDTPEVSVFRWDFITTPVAAIGRRPLSHMVINSTKTHPEMLARIEDILYGTAEAEPRLPGVQEIINLFANFVPSTELSVTDLGNGMFTVEGSDVEVSGDIFTINAPPAIDNGDGTFTIY